MNAKRKKRESPLRAENRVLREELERVRSALTEARERLASDAVRWRTFTANRTAMVVATNSLMAQLRHVGDAFNKAGL